MTAAEKIQHIRIEIIDPCPVNPRKNFDEAQLGELTVSVAKMGITNPIIVRPGWSPVTDVAGKERFELICGHRRTEAAKRAGLMEVPAIIRELSDADALDLAIVDNLQRVDLSPMEEAEGYATLMKVAYASKDDLESHAGEIALKVGKTLRYVIQRLKLLSLIPEARDVMRRGFLSLDVALLIARLQPADQERALIYAIDHRKASKGKTLAERCEDAIRNLQGDIANWLRASTEKEMREWIANNITLSLKQAPWALDDGALLPVAGACTDCLKRVGNNTTLFGDLTAKEDTCTDPACYGSKQKAFVKLTLKEAAETGAPVLKLSTSRSNQPIKEGSELLKTKFKQGQWVEAKKGSCPDTHRGVTEEGEFKTVCVNQKCKIHKHQIEQPRSAGQRTSWQEQEKQREEEQKQREKIEKLESPIRQKVWLAILQRLNTKAAIHIAAEKIHGAAQIKKQLVKMLPGISGEHLDA